jgi:uncharacterized repeat protein (TIGR03803 family)
MQLRRSVALVCGLGLVLTFGLVRPVRAQAVEIVHSFTRATPATGEWPAWAPIDLVRGEGNTLYGATRYGGADCTSDTSGSSCGVVFELDPGAAGFRVIHELGYTPYWQRVRLSWFGTGELFATESNNPPSSGRLFKLTPTAGGEWASKILHPFASDTWDEGAQQWTYDGRGPEGPVMLGVDGYLYGTTVAGGGLHNHQAEGTLYRVWPDGSGYERLYSFHRDNRLPSGIVGLNPLGALVTGPDGHIYGTASYGGSEDPYFPGYGTIYRYRTDTGQVEKVHSFADTRTAYAPQTGLVRGPGGQLFGTTGGGGPSYAGTVYGMSAAPEAGAFASVTVLHSFAGPQDGRMPVAELVRAPDGFLYGAAAGGLHDQGVVFRIRPNGTGYEIVHAFTGGEDGGTPSSALVVGSDGSLYGAASAGGATGGGVIYRIRISPQALITGLIEEVKGLLQRGDLRRGQAYSLIGKLQLALWLLRFPDGERMAAVALDLFVLEVDFYVRTGVLSPEEGNPLLETARGVIAQLRAP